MPRNPRPEGARKPGVAGKYLEADRPSTRHGYVKSFDGTKLFYSVEGTGKPLVFLYGIVCSSLHWTYQIDYFRKNYQTIWLDYRGHQNSEVPKNMQSLTLENIARDVRVVLDEVGVESSVVLGHSMGVNVVLELYRMFPERIKGMVLANGTATRPLETLLGSNVTQPLFKWLGKAYRAQPDLLKFFWKLQLRTPLSRSIVSMGGFNPHLTPQADIDLYLEQVADTDPGILISLIQNYDHADATAWLHTVKVPTLVIAGEQDTIVPVRQQELLHQLIPGSRFEKIRHGSHCPQMDLPDLVNLKIERFLTEIGYAPEAPSQPTETASRPSGSHPFPG